MLRKTLITVIGCGVMAFGCQADALGLSFSMTRTGGSEGSGGIGAIHIPGTPEDAREGGSLMNSCFRANETGEFTSSDRSALQTLY